MLTGTGAVADAGELVTAGAIGPGCVLGHWYIEAEIGRGGTGVVYRAHDRRTGEPLALKCVGSVGADALKHEFRVLGRLRHPNLVRLRELRQLGASTVFSMDLVEGAHVLAPLAGMLDAERTDWSRRAFSQLADALSHLHGAGLVHRDIKPANVMVERSGKVVLLDFGLTRSFDPEPSAGSDTLWGTLAYLAPERFRGARAEPASDWFSFGVLLFEALVGELPFGADAQRTVMAWCSGKPVPDLERRLPPSARGFAPLLRAVLEPHPAGRPDGPAIVAALQGQRRGVAARAMLGRERDLAWLEEHAGALGAPPVVLALTGESGVGKTTLARELARRSVGRGAVALLSRCHPREQLPFNALNEVALELLARQRLSGEPRAAREREAAELVAEVFDGPPAPGARAYRGTREELGRALLELLGAAAARGRVLVCVDDAQWIDADSEWLLELLLRAAPERCDWLFVVRGEAADLPASLRDRVQAVHRLGRLEPEVSLALIRELRPALPASTAQRILAVAGGHPLAIEQACSWGAAELARAAWSSPEELLAAQAAERSDEQRALLSLLAVHEGAAPADVLYACGLRSVSDIYDLLDVGLLNFERAGVSYNVSIRHARVAQTLRARLSEREIREAHSRLADAYSSVRRGSVEAIFGHLVGAGRVREALPFGLAGARVFRERLAFERAAERLHWLIEQESSADRRGALLVELAEVLALAGSASRAADTYLSALELAPASERRRLRRQAAEQLLRAGRVGEGRALLAVCAREVGLSMPEGRAQQLFGIVARRCFIGLSRPRITSREPPPEAIQQRLEVAWSAGLGLNLVDVVGSALAQAQFTSLALRHGSPDQMLRAWAVEYSYRMNALGARAGSKGDAMRELLERELERTRDDYTRAIAWLSWAAGDYFRGAPALALPRAQKARAVFETMLGSSSWELANCCLYESWCLLDLARTGELVARVWSARESAEERGDTLQRRYWTGGPCSIAWLVRDRPDELERLLEPPSAAPAEGSFELADLFELMARVYLALYRNQAARARSELEAARGRIRQSGLERLTWFRFVLSRLWLQSALADPEGTSPRELWRWQGRLARSAHPAAVSWAGAFAALITARTAGGRFDPAPLALAAERLDDSGQHLSALGVRHVLARRGFGDVPRWPSDVVDPDRLARVVAFGLP